MRAQVAPAAAETQPRHAPPPRRHAHLAEAPLPVKIRTVDWKIFATWATGIVLGLLCLAWVMRFESSRQMQHSAETAGLRWAGFASRTVPDLDAALAGRGFTPAAREQLLRLRQADSVFRFKLFDPAGNLLLVSDDLDHPDVPPRHGPTEGIGADHNGGSKAHIRTKLLAGINHIELKREQRADRPAVYSEAYVPVLRNGSLLGVVEVYVDQVGEAQAIQSAFARVAAAVALLLLLVLGVAAWQFWQRLRKQRLAEERVRYMAHHDVLSGALNRSSFNEALKRAIWRHDEGGPGFALLCIDLDRFKEVNDSLGHAAGDEVLRVATQRLRDALREGDKVARLGGDEFAVLLSGLTTVAAVNPLAQRVVSALAEPYEVAGQRVICGGSVGVAIHGVDATEPAELLHKADLALYRAKAAGRGTFSYYDSATDELLKVRRELTRDLQQALAAGQMSLHYQPLHASGSGALTGYEALLRWTHPTRGNVPSMDFITLAEETGLIDALGLWVLKRACADAAAWPDSLSVAINLSPAQFARGDLVAAVAAALASSGLPAHRLELEITESMLLRNAEQVLEQLRALSALGVAIAMDDFGTGYSSLAYLWRFPFDKVKIDRAFTQHLGRDPKVDLIVRSIITLAHSLDIRVNAEGVETPSQMATLQAHGCDELQGFLLGRPGPLAGLTHTGHAGTAGFGGPGPSTEPAPSRRSAPRESLFADLPGEPLPTWLPTAPTAM